MPGIVEFPKIIQDALEHYGDLFDNQCQRRHFAEYLTGLIVAERKTVLGIHDEFARTTDQSCLNRFLTEAPWDVQDLNERRLEQLQEDPTTRYSDQGVIPIDNTLIDREGLLIPDAGWYWDHAEDRYKVAQDYLFIDYVCTSGKHYPLEFRLFRKQEVCQAIGEPFRNHTALCCELIDWVCERDIPGDFTMDCYFTSAEVLNYIHGKPDRFGRPRGYVGDLKSNRKVQWKGSLIKVNELAASIPPEDRKELRMRGSAAVVLHRDAAHPGGESQGADRDPLALSPGPGADQAPGDEPDHLGGESDRAGVPASLDGHGDLPSGRQAAVGTG